MRVGAGRGARSDRWYAPLARVLRRSSAKFGLAITLAFLVLTVAAPLIAPYDPFEQDFSSALSAPSAFPEKQRAGFASGS